MKGTFIISDIEGKEVEVTDLEAAIKEAKQAVDWHDACKKDKETNPESLYFPKAHDDWNHKLLELEKLQINLAHHAR